jgi:hypothetical protein
VFVIAAAASIKGEKTFVSFWFLRWQMADDSLEPVNLVLCMIFNGRKVLVHYRLTVWTVAERESDDEIATHTRNNNFRELMARSAVLRCSQVGVPPPPLIAPVAAADDSFARPLNQQRH